METSRVGSCCLAAGLLVLLLAGGARPDEPGQPPVRFSELPLRVRESAGLFDPRNSMDTDNPFGFFAHRELPEEELVRLLSDMGLGHARLPQSDPFRTVPLARKLGLDLIVYSGLPRNPGFFAKLVSKFKGEIKYYQTDGDEPNNRRTKPEAFVEQMTRAHAILRAADPLAKLLMDDLGDEGTADYFKKCLDAGLARCVDYCPYGYFTWGHALPLYLRMQALADQSTARGQPIKLFLTPLTTFGTGGMGLYKNQKHFIEFFWRGAEFINMYKFIDWSGQFGLLHYDGRLSAGYAGFQTLCQFFGRDVPPDHTMQIKAEREPPVTVFREEKVVARAFRNKRRLLIAAWLGEGRFNRRNDCPSGDTMRLTIPTASYRYPVCVNLVTGRTHDLPYAVEGDSVVVRNVPADGFAWCVLLLRHNPEWETARTHGVDPRQQRPNAWRTVSNMKGAPGDWVTAILPDDAGGAWIGLYSLENRDVAVAYVSPALHVKLIPFEAGKRKPAPYARPVVKLVRHGDYVYGTIRGTARSARGCFFRFKPGAERVTEVFDPAEHDKSFSTCGFTDMAVDRKGRVWLTALGTSWEGRGGLDGGEGVAVFDAARAKWIATYRHHRDGELAGNEGVKGQFADRITALAIQPDGRVWVSAMGSHASYFDGKRWYWLQNIGRGNEPLLCAVRAQGYVWFGGDSNVYRARDLTTPAEERESRIANRMETLSEEGGDDTPAALTPRETRRSKPIRRRFDVERFGAETIGITGRVLCATSDGTRVWFTTRYGGVSACELSTGKWTHWRPGENGLPDSMIEGITAHRGSVWVWTWGGGIARLTGNRWVRTTRREGLADNRASTIVPGLGGRLWIGTFRGLSVSQ